MEKMVKVILLFSIVCSVHGNTGYDPPENITCVAISSQAIKLTWDPPSVPESNYHDYYFHYKVKYKLVNNSYEEEPQYTFKTSIILIGLKANANYFVQMQSTSGYNVKRSEPIFCATHKDIIANETSSPQLASRSENPGLTSAVTLVVRHSQSNEVPVCPGEQGMVFNGYSVKEIIRTKDKRDEYQPLDLGSVASCSKTISPIRLLESDHKDNQRDTDDVIKRYFLATASTVASGFSQLPENETILEHISRCAVCAVQSPIITLHSKSTEVPACPNGWSALWTGFSYLMPLGNDREDNVMTSTGSCVENFVNNYGIACDEDWKCKTSPIWKKNYWLLAKSELASQVGKCVVCKIVAK